MIDTTNWNYVFKTWNGQQNTTNVMYSPLCNPEENILCMHWDKSDPYQKESTRLTDELMNFFFEREINYIQKFQSYDWAPKLIDIDLANKKVFLEWNPETLNRIIFKDGKDLNNVCPDWKDQIFQILKDITDNDCYKMALYPHCFYITNGTIKTFDFYSCLLRSERYIDRKYINGLIGPDSGKRFDDATVGNNIDFDIFFKHTLTTHLGNIWPDNPFPEYYKKLYD
jgi:hypothetical protein